MSTDGEDQLREAWRVSLPTDRELWWARRRVHFKAIVAVLASAAGYWGAVLSGWPWWPRMIACAPLTLGLVAVATGVMHDANHGSFSRWSWLNRGAAWSSDALGASSFLWRVQHNALHHPNTNVHGIDGDIEQPPFARLAPSQPWRRWHRAQHVYMWPLYGFLAMKNLLVSDLVTLMRKRMGPVDLRERLTGWVMARIVAGKLFHLAWAVVLPLMFNPWWKVLLFYVACSWIVGFTLAVLFQLADCVDIADFHETDAPRRGTAFLAHQLSTTVDIASGRFAVVFRWLAGGLDHQIEHHLAPRFPHTVYAKTARRFRANCAALGLAYRSHPGIGAAVRSHLRWLRAMGTRPAGGT